MDFSAIKLLILDVDGVLTDGRVTATADGDASKRFHVHDGSAIQRWRKTGGKVAILSGRKSRDVEDRAAELAVDWVHLGVDEKLGAYDVIVASAECDDAAVAYVGDDLPDVPPMTRCVMPIAVADAAPAVKRTALYVTKRAGGDGAVAEAIEWLLRKRSALAHHPVAEGRAPKAEC